MASGPPAACSLRGPATLQAFPGLDYLTEFSASSVVCKPRSVNRGDVTRQILFMLALPSCAVPRAHRLRSFQPHAHQMALEPPNAPIAAIAFQSDKTASVLRVHANVRVGRPDEDNRPPSERTGYRRMLLFCSHGLRGKLGVRDPLPTNPVHERSRARIPGWVAGAWFSLNRICLASHHPVEEINLNSLDCARQLKRVMCAAIGTEPDNRSH